MKNKKRALIAEVIVGLGKVKTYSAEELAAMRFRRVDGTIVDTRCILVSTARRDLIIKLLGERL